MLVARRSLIAAALPSAALSQSMPTEQTWKFATAYEDSNFQTRNNIRFATEFSRGTQTRLRVEMETSGRRLGMAEILPAVQAGSIQLGEILLPDYGATDPMFEVSGLPMLATSYDRARRLHDAALQSLQSRLTPRRLELLYVVPWPPAGFFGREPLTNLAQLRGTRIRTYNSVTDKLVLGLGGTPVRLATTAIEAALEARRLDWIITSPPTAVDANVAKHFKVYNPCGFTLVWNGTLVNSNAVLALPEPWRLAMRRAAEDARTRGWALSEAALVETLRILRQDGMTIAETPGTVLSGIAEAAEPIVQEWKRRTGGDGTRLLDAYRS